MKYRNKKRSSAILYLGLAVTSAVSSSISNVFGWKNIKSGIHSTYNYGKSGLGFVGNSVRKVYNFFYNRLSGKTKKGFQTCRSGIY